MRVSTLQSFNRSLESLTDNQTLLRKAQARVLAEGRRITKASDDPIRAIQGQNIRLEMGRLEQFVFSSEAANLTLSKEEAYIASAQKALEEIRVKLNEVKNDARDGRNRESTAKEIDAQLKELERIANVKDENGNYVFAGFKGTTKPFTLDAQGQFVYNGDQGQAKLTIADGVSIVKQDSGHEVFQTVREGNGRFATAASQSNQGTGIINTGTMSDPSQTIDDTYTITLVGLNSSGKFAYQVTDSSNTVIVPASGNSPDDAPEFVSGGEINFNGISVSIDKNPAKNDTFTITPSQNKSILNMGQEAAAAARLPVNNDVERTYASNQVDSALNNIDQALEKLRDIRSGIGARKNAIASIVKSNQAFTSELTTQLKTVEDIDFVESISEMVFQSSMLQAAQQSFVKIQQLSVFNYL